MRCCANLGPGTVATAVAALTKTACSTWGSTALRRIGSARTASRSCASTVSASPTLLWDAPPAFPRKNDWGCATAGKVHILVPTLLEVVKVTQGKESKKTREPPEGSLHAGSTRPTDCQRVCNETTPRALYASSRLFTSPLSGFNGLNAAGELSTPA